MKKYLLILILFLCTLITSCTLPGQNQGNSNQNDIYYTVFFDSNYGSFVESQNIKNGSNAIKPVDPIKENFKFLYWEFNNEEYDFNTPVTSNITLIAKWEEVGVHTHFYTTNVIEPTCTLQGYTQYICDCGYIYLDNYIDELGHNEVYHEAKTPTETEIGWDAYVTCTRCDYSTYIEIPATGKISIEIYVKDGKQYFNLGSYPQTHINDSALIEELNKLTTVNARGYYEYNGEEYAKMTPQINNVFNEELLFSTGKPIENGVTEWFIVEPIVWRILESDNDTYKVISEYILDLSCYSNASSSSNWNNYKNSQIRKFLNDEFYNSAFNNNEKTLIIDTEVDNSVSTADSLENSYVCENTFDKIYLLSYQDVINPEYGFAGPNETDYSKIAEATDYAKGNDLLTTFFNHRTSWWIRTPYSADANEAYYISNVGRITYFYVYNIYGVRPATTVSFN